MMQKKAIVAGILTLLIGLAVLPGFLLVTASITTDDRPFKEVAWPNASHDIQPNEEPEFIASLADADRLACIELAPYPSAKRLKDIFSKDTTLPMGLRDEMLFFTYTDSLYNSVPLPNDLDSLYSLVRWADQYVMLGAHDGEMSLVLRSIGNYWLEKAGHHLAAHNGTWRTGRYSYRSRFIRDYLRSRNIQSKTYTSSLEKLFNYSIDGRWNYIIDRIWLGTGWTVKAILLLFLAIGLFCLGYTFYGMLFAFLKNRRKHHS